MRNYPLTESFSVIADWYLPGRQGEKLVGTLAYSPDGIVLELEDSFQPLDGAIHGGEALRVPLIHGLSRAGERFTLINAVRRGFRLTVGPAGPIQPDRFFAPLVLMGTHSDVDPVLSELSCRVPGLHIWLSRQTVEPQIDSDDHSIATTFRVHTLPAETIRIPALSADLVFDVVSSTQLNPFSAAVVTVGSWRLVPDSPQPLSWYLDQIVTLTSFLSLCAGVPMPPDCITIPTESKFNRASVLAHRPDEKHCSLGQHHEFFLTRGGFAETFSICLAQWFDTYPKIETPIGLAMSILASEKLWPHVEFLSLMQALEGFHRSIDDVRYMADGEYKSVEESLIKAIPGEVSRDHRASLKSRIHYGNEISLAKRLQTLAQKFSKPIRSMLFGDVARLPQKWIDTRNYYTHWDDSSRSKILTGQEMIYANTRLRTFLRLLYLDLCEIPQAAILQALTGFSSEAQFLIQIRGVERRASNPDDKTGTLMYVHRNSASQEDSN